MVGVHYSPGNEVPAWMKANGGDRMVIVRWGPKLFLFSKLRKDRHAFSEYRLIGIGSREMKFNLGKVEYPSYVLTQNIQKALNTYRPVSSVNALVGRSRKK